MWRVLRPVELTPPAHSSTGQRLFATIRYLSGQDIPGVSLAPRTAPDERKAVDDLERVLAHLSMRGGLLGGVTATALRHVPDQVRTHALYL